MPNTVVVPLAPNVLLVAPPIAVVPTVTVSVALRTLAGMSKKDKLPPAPPPPPVTLLAPVVPAPPPPPPPISTPRTNPPPLEMVGLLQFPVTVKIATFTAIILYSLLH